jgi:hypothetical protein
LGPPGALKNRADFSRAGVRYLLAGENPMLVRELLGWLP